MAEPRGELMGDEGEDEEVKEAREVEPPEEVTGLPVAEVVPITTDPDLTTLEAEVEVLPVEVVEVVGAAEVRAGLAAHRNHLTNQDDRRRRRAGGPAGEAPLTQMTAPVAAESTNARPRPVARDSATRLR